MNKSIIMGIDINSDLFEFEKWYKEILSVSTSIFTNNDKYYFDSSYRYPIKSINVLNSKKGEKTRYPTLPFFGVKVFLNALRLYLIEDNDECRECCKSLLELSEYEGDREFNIKNLYPIDIYKYDNWRTFWYMHSDVIPLYNVDNSTYVKLEEFLIRVLKKIKNRLKNFSINKRLIDFDDTGKEILMYDYGSVYEIYFTLRSRLKKHKEIKKFQYEEEEEEMGYTFIPLDLSHILFSKWYELPPELEVTYQNNKLHQLLLVHTLEHIKMNGYSMEKQLAVSHIINIILSYYNSNIGIPEKDVERFSHSLISYLDHSVHSLYHYFNYHGFFQSHIYHGIIKDKHELPSNSFGLQNKDIENTDDYLWYIIKRS